MGTDQINIAMEAMFKNWRVGMSTYIQYTVNEFQMMRIEEDGRLQVWLGFMLLVPNHKKDNTEIQHAMSLVNEEGKWVTLAIRKQITSK